MTEEISLAPIGVIESPYKEKFAIPRQPGLVSAAKGKVILTGEANNPDLVRELAQFSHLWLVFIFHGTQEQGWKPLVRPPRLGGNQKVGVLATRSTFRPNPVGLSVVKLDKVVHKTVNFNKQVELHISGLDLLDKTPIIDIKPYVPYSDAITEAKAGYAQQQPNKSRKITFSKDAQARLSSLKANYPDLEQLIQQVLSQDPRPAYKQDKPDDKNYGMTLYDFNIIWQVITLNEIHVKQINDQSMATK